MILDSAAFFKIKVTFFFLKYLSPFPIAFSQSLDIYST